MRRKQPMSNKDKTPKESRTAESAKNQNNLNSQKRKFFQIALFLFFFASMIVPLALADYDPTKLGQWLSGFISGATGSALLVFLAVGAIALILTFAFNSGILSYLGRAYTLEGLSNVFFHSVSGGASSMITRELIEAFLSRHDVKDDRETLEKLEEVSLEIELLRRIRNLPGNYTSIANYSLALGLIFLAVGLAIIFFLVSQDNFIEDLPENSALNQHFYTSIAAHYIPRLALALTIEIVGVFFLRMYSANLAHARYYEDEITSVELRLISLSHFSKDSELHSELLNKLCEIDRNSVIETGKTTPELERRKLDYQNLESGIDRSVSILSKLNLLKNAEKKE